MTAAPSKVSPFVFLSTFGCGGFVFLLFSVFPAQCWRLGRLSALPQSHGRGRLCGKWFVGGWKAVPLARNLGLGRQTQAIGHASAKPGSPEHGWAWNCPTQALGHASEKLGPPGRGWGWGCPTQAFGQASAKPGPKDAAGPGISRRRRCATRRQSVGRQDAARAGVARRRQSLGFQNAAGPGIARRRPLARRRQS